MPRSGRLWAWRSAPSRFCSATATRHSAPCSTAGGIGYVVLNAAVSYGAFWVLYHWLDTPPADASGQSDTLHLLGLAAGAGFGGERQPGR